MNPVRIIGVAVNEERIEFALTDGRRISAPVTWSRRLISASAAERADYSISPSGTVVEWPSIDEHIGLWSMLRAPEQVVPTRRVSNDRQARLRRKKSKISSSAGAGGTARARG